MQVFQQFRSPFWAGKEISHKQHGPLVAQQLEGAGYRTSINLSSWQWPSRFLPELITILHRLAPPVTVRISLEIAFALPQNTAVHRDLFFGAQLVGQARYFSGLSFFLAA